MLLRILRIPYLTYYQDQKNHLLPCNLPEGASEQASMSREWEVEWEHYLAEFQQHPALHAAADYLSNISPSVWCRIFYLLATGCVLVVASTPAEARSLLVDYGARKASSSMSPTSSISRHRNTTRPGQETKPTGKQNRTLENKNKKKKGGKNIFISLVAVLTSWGQIPHSWFSAFYVLSVGCSLFWASQYYLLHHSSTQNYNDSNGESTLQLSLPLQIITWKQVSTAGTAPSGTTPAQLFLAWGMMFLQGIRRIYEHMVIIKPSSKNNKKSTIWVVHWILGLGFYFVTNIAVWVEGSGTLSFSYPPPTPTSIKIPNPPDTLGA